MSIERLQRIVVPPSDPKEVPSVTQWNEVELQFIRLPKDYRDFINKYGSGSLDSFIWVFNPGSSNPNLNLEQQIDKQLEALQEINANGLEPSIPLFPDRSGVLPFGVTDNGDILLWETRDEADWSVCVLPARTSPLMSFPVNLTDFLAGICEGSIHCEAFPNDFPSLNPIFTSENHD